jgi:DNA mismatch repair protein MLH3
LKAGQPYVDSTSASSRRFQKEDLRNAQVIEQVDRKFIACLINDSSTETATATTRTLVLIDQHAADERVRVERFLKELCLGYLSNVNVGEDRNDRLRLRDLSPPVPILLTRHEERQLRNLSTRRVFGHWGFLFVEPAVEAVHETEQGIDAGSASGYSQVFVQGVPELVADKVRFVPKSQNPIAYWLSLAFIRRRTSRLCQSFSGEGGERSPSCPDRRGERQR